ncbi:HU domain-containing protein [Chryseobacterium oryzae]|uniref:CCDC81-like prokaryotic HU domain-containing protein n=1 Tax=Chryseobacterium oryzae TaxID=2929799 RepID=A0ABY4BFN3_9FLAO|nr:hypothetical protein [Chryseobacterium oryzae]UOE37972.1 hypothetical protein MTP08_13095 [Chryseobacterium oryzae]
MNISAYILEYLKQFGTVVVPQFGAFSLENSKAVINSENGSILPPSSQINFQQDYHIQDRNFTVFLSQQKQISEASAERELYLQVDFWKKRLQSEKTLDINGLGTLSLENDQFVFKGNRLQSDDPDFYGLEEIRFSEINDQHPTVSEENSEKDYKLNKSILWIFLFIVPVLGILYFAYTQQELIFGKKSFDDLSVKTKTQRIEKKAPVKIDSAKIKFQDSVKAFKADSLKQDSIKKQSAKSWKPTSHKRKSKWQK